MVKYHPPKAERGMPSVDVPPTPERSRIMKLIKSKGTKPELAMWKALRRWGLRPTRNCRSVKGTPDFCFKRAKVAVFVDNAFWHGLAGVPKTNTAWWTEKFRRTRRRDQKFTRFLKKHGWTVLRFTDEEVAKEPDYLAITVAVAVAMRRTLK